MLLTNRGMNINENDDAKRWLSTVSYYRLGAYWLPNEEPAAVGQQRSRKFKPGTNFSSVTKLYVLDRRLRLLVMEAIDRIEIAVRTQWTYQMAMPHGAHAHCNRNLFRNPRYYNDAIDRLSNQVENSGELFIQHYRSKYSNPPLPPLWMVTELMTFGDLSKWIDNTKTVAQIKLVARAIGLPSADTLTTVLQVLVLLRNHCAHHGRLWNQRLLKRPPLIQSFKSDLHIQENGHLDNKIYNVLVILCKLLEHQSPETTFRRRLYTLLLEFSTEQQNEMGFPKGWKAQALSPEH